MLFLYPMEGHRRAAALTLPQTLKQDEEKLSCLKDFRKGFLSFSKTCLRGSYHLLRLLLRVTILFKDMFKEALSFPFWKPGGRRRHPSSGRLSCRRCSRLLLGKSSCPI